MDRGNGTVRESPKPGSWNNTTVTIYCRVPGELKFLVHSWQNACRLPTFNAAIQRLLETHPDLAKHAASLYNSKKEEGGV